MTTLLSANRLPKQFPGLLAVNEVDVEVTAGSVHGIIGPNGAGKTTMIRTLLGHGEGHVGDPAPATVGLRQRDGLDDVGHRRLSSLRRDWSPAPPIR